MNIFYQMIALPLVFYSTTSLGSSTFPDSWIGKWTGKAQTVRDQKIQRTMQMTLEIRSTENPDVFDFQIQYEGEKVRQYELVAKNRSRGHWVLDEKNGILIDSFYSQNILRSLFMVNGKIIPFRYEKNRNRIHIDSPIFQAVQPNISGTPDFSVSSFSIINSQIALLKKNE
ncbi:MAG: hypothetical protein CL678_17225 [Bdellovibrionaceae bacterium]|nr:hypothetical protein [Pseudobdellovibrionaceae bacterium]|tara:strand:+ start:8415 stop:8927 length:513 start_codon:yes stop_codon:yes gene_type:complete